MQQPNSYFSGVLSGLTVVLLLYFLRNIILKLLSALAGIFTRNISGNWHTQFWKGNETFEETAVAHQLFHWVWGEITFVKEGKPKKYIFKGSFREHILVATFEIVGSKSILDRGAFTLTLTHDAQKMIGRYSWTDAKDPEPQADRYEWTKK